MFRCGLLRLNFSLAIGILRALFQVEREVGAGSGNRTRIFSLEGCCTTIVLYPPRPDRTKTDPTLAQESERHRCSGVAGSPRLSSQAPAWWGKQDSNLRRRTPGDLQSPP